MGSRVQARWYDRQRPEAQACVVVLSVNLIIALAMPALKVCLNLLVRHDRAILYLVCNLLRPDPYQ